MPLLLKLSRKLSKTRKNLFLVNCTVNLMFFFAGERMKKALVLYCSSLLSVAVIKPHDQRQLGQERVYLTYVFRKHSVMRQVRTET